MMRILFFLLLISSSVIGQEVQPPSSRYTPVNSTGYNWLRGYFRSLGLPARDTSFDNGQWNGPGAVVFNPIDSNLYVWNGTKWMRQLNSKDSIGGGGSPIKDEGNGSTVKTIGDSLRFDIGGRLNENVTHIYLPVGMKTDQNTIAQSKNFVISNRPLEEDMVDADFPYWNQRGSNTLLNLSRKFEESKNDTAYQQYNGALRIYTKFQFDENSPRFRYDNKYIMLQEGGANVAVHTMLPKDSVRVVNGPFGRTGAAGTFTVGYGDYWGYNTVLKPSDSNPNYPGSAVFGQVDFVRNIDNSVQKKMSGRMSVYLAGWKFYQAPINSGTYESGNRLGYVSDLYSYGSWYPLLGVGVTKEKVLRVSRVDTAIGVHLLPKRDPYGNPNEVVNGYGIKQDGLNDINTYEGYNYYGTNGRGWGESGSTVPQLRRTHYDTDVAFWDTLSFKEKMLLYTNITSRRTVFQMKDPTGSLHFGDLNESDFGHIYATGYNRTGNDNRGGWDFIAVNKAALSGVNKVKFRFYIRDNKTGGTGDYNKYFQIDEDSIMLRIKPYVKDTISDFVPLLTNKTTNSIARTDWKTFIDMIGYGAEEKAFVDSLQNGFISDSTQQKLIIGLSGNYDTVYTYYKVYPATTWDSTRAFLIPKYQNTGLITAGTNVTLTGTGTPGDPFVINAAGGGSSAITVGTTTVSSGTSGRMLYNNGGVVGEKTVTGSGDVVLATSPALAGTPTAPNQSWNTISTGIVNGNTARDMIFNYALKPFSGTGGATNLTPIGDAFYENYAITGLSTNILGISAPSGSSQFQGNCILFALDDNGTARSISGWNAAYRAGDIALPTTTVVGKVMYIQFVKHVSGSWDLVGLTYINK